MFIRKCFATATMTALAFAASHASAAPTGELGILNTSGTNPATGSQWAAGDTYHLIYVTSSATDATSTDIADYNAFVQADADANGMGSIDWFALGSTVETDAVDNAVLNGPVLAVRDNSGTLETIASVATDADDFWDFNWGDSNEIAQLDGTDTNIWTGTNPDGVASGGNELGATNESTRRHWTGWTDWGPAFATQGNADSLEMAAISQELTVVPEPSSLGLGLLGLGGLLMARRRRG